MDDRGEHRESRELHGRVIDLGVIRASVKNAGAFEWSAWFVEHSPRAALHDAPTVSSVSMVGLAGFEPTTTCPPDKCATKLRYSPLCYGCRA